MDVPDCNSTDCSFCSQLRRAGYLSSKAQARDRLAKIVDEHFARTINRPIITEVFDEEYQEWVDNNLSLEGRSL